MSRHIAASDVVPMLTAWVASGGHDPAAAQWLHQAALSVCSRMSGYAYEPADLASYAITVAYSEPARVLAWLDAARIANDPAATLATYLRNVVSGDRAGLCCPRSQRSVIAASSDEVQEASQQPAGAPTVVDLLDRALAEVGHSSGVLHAWMHRLGHPSEHKGRSAPARLAVEHIYSEYGVSLSSRTEHAIAAGAGRAITLARYATWMAFPHTRVQIQRDLDRRLETYPGLRARLGDERAALILRSCDHSRPGGLDRTERRHAQALAENPAQYRHISRQELAA